MNRFVLYSSRNSVGGGPYVVEAAYDLELPYDADDTGAAKDDYDFAEAFGLKD